MGAGGMREFSLVTTIVFFAGVQQSRKLIFAFLRKEEEHLERK